MKKLIFVICIVLVNCLQGQVSESTKKIGSFIDVLKKSDVTTNQIDSIRAEAVNLYNETEIAEQRLLLKKVISLAGDLKNTYFTSRKINTSFESLDKNIQKKYTYDFDKFKQVAFIDSKRSRLDQLRLYLVVKEGMVRMRWVTRYYGSGWLFFEKVSLIIDGKNYEYEVSSPDREVMSAGNVLEKSDMAVDENLLTIIESIKNSSQTIELRLSGNKYFDTKLTSGEKENILSTLELYNLLIK